MDVPNQPEHGVLNNGVEPIVNADVEEDGKNGKTQLWDVEKIEDVKVLKNQLQFLVVWMDKTTSWEPKYHFPGGLKHERILDFVEREPKKYSTAVKRLQSNSKKWDYKVDDSTYEKADESLPVEAKRLADPNRLVDNKEQLIMHYDDGSRTSRSKTKNLFQALNLTEPSTSSQHLPTTPDHPPEKKKQQRKRKQKKNAETPAHVEDPIKNKPGPEINELKESTTSEKRQKTESIVPEEQAKAKTEEVIPETKGKKWIPKVRAKALNSSDSDSDIDETKTAIPNSAPINNGATSSSSLSDRIEGGANTRSVPQETGAAAASEAPVKKKLKRVDEVQRKGQSSRNLQTKKPTDYVAKSNNKEQKTPVVRDPRVVYADDRNDEHALEKEFAELGITLMKEFDRNSVLEEFNERKKIIMRRPGATLDFAISKTDEALTEILLVAMGPQRALIELSEVTSLHELMTNAYQQRSRENANATEIKNRAKKIEQIVRIAIALVQHEILIVQDRKSFNTLLHCAINTQDASLVGYLLRMGSPVHVRNTHEMTAVEACIVIKNACLLELVLRHGGSFHHIMARGVADDFVDHRALFAFLARQHGREIEAVYNVIESHSRRVQEACDRVRTKLIASRLVEREFGPLISFPRGNLKHSCYQQTIQFAIPESWMAKKKAKFMLAIIPMAYDNIKNLFVASGKKVSLKFLPYLSGQPCRPMTKKSGIFFRATSALREHFRKVAQNGHRHPTDQEFANYRHYPTLEGREKCVMDRNMNTSHPRLCTLSLSFDQMTVFSFVVCQLILYEPDKNAARPKLVMAARSSYSKNASSSREPTRSAHRPPAHSESRPSAHFMSQNKPSNRPPTPYNN